MSSSLSLFFLRKLSFEYYFIVAAQYYSFVLNSRTVFYETPYRQHRNIKLEKKNVEKFFIFLQSSNNTDL